MTSRIAGSWYSGTIWPDSEKLAICYDLAVIRSIIRLAYRGESWLMYS
jgi:hypothetical protein